jgi:hypothetical protein
VLISHPRFSNPDPEHPQFSTQWPVFTVANEMQFRGSKFGMYRSADTVVETGAGIRTGDEILGPGELAYVRREELNLIQIRS